MHCPAAHGLVEGSCNRCARRSMMSGKTARATLPARRRRPVCVMDGNFDARASGLGRRGPLLRCGISRRFGDQHSLGITPRVKRARSRRSSPFGAGSPTRLERMKAAGVQRVHARAVSRSAMAPFDQSRRCAIVSNETCRGIRLTLGRICVHSSIETAPLTSRPTHCPSAAPTPRSPRMARFARHARVGTASPPWVSYRLPRPG